MKRSNIQWSMVSGQWLKNQYRIQSCLLLIIPCLLLILTSCSVSKSSFTPSKKYSPEQLNKDYSIFRGALEESHPGVYWYTPKAEMDKYFDWGKEQIRDSLNEEGFRKVLNYVISKMDCGHTVSRASKAFIKYRDTSQKIFSAES